VGPERGGEVEDRAGGGGDGDAVVRGDLGAAERARLVDPQPGASRAAGASG